MTPRQIGAFAIGPLGGALISLLTLPFIAWFFSQENVGRMAMLQVTLSFSTLFFSLGLDQSYVREFHEVEDKTALLKRAIWPGLALLSTSLLVILQFPGALSSLLFGVSDAQLSMLVAVALFAGFLSRFLSLVLRMNERGLAFSMSQVLPKVLVLAILVFYVTTGADNSLDNLIIANTAAITFACLVFVWNTRAEWYSSVSSKMDFDRLLAMLRYGLPLILGGLAFWGLTAIDKLFLRALSGFDELGIYSVAVSFASAAAILQSVFSTVWVPIVYKWASKGSGLENVHKVTRYILILVVVGFSLAGLFSWIVTLILPTDYRSVQWILVSCLGYPLLYTLSETTVIGIGISRRSEFAMMAAVAAFLVNVLGNFWLVPRYGAAGAAASTCFSFWVFFILRTEFSIYVWKPIPRALLYGYSTVVVFGSCVFSLAGETFGSAFMLFWVAVLISIVFVFPRELTNAWRFVLRRKIS